MRCSHQSKFTQLERGRVWSQAWVFLNLEPMWSFYLSFLCDFTQLLLRHSPFSCCSWDMWFLSWRSLQFGGKDRWWEIPFFSRALLLCSSHKPCEAAGGGEGHHDCTHLQTRRVIFRGYEWSAKVKMRSWPQGLWLRISYSFFYPPPLWCTQELLRRVESPF